MKIEKHALHAISWVDLAARDLQGQTAFYTEMMGWNTFTAPGTAYTMFLVGDMPVAGVLGMSEEMGDMPSVWSTYVNVEDAAATCARAAELGGMVFQEPFEIPNGGRIAVIADPSGAALCLFEGGSDTGFRLLDEPGAPCWFEDMSHDAPTAVEFYRELFGWRPEPMPGPMDYQVFHLGEASIAGCMQLGEGMPEGIPSHWQVSFSINGPVEEFMEKAKGLGASVLMGPMHTDFGSGAVIADPAGAHFVAFDRSTGTM